MWRLGAARRVNFVRLEAAAKRSGARKRKRESDRHVRLRAPL